MKTMNYLVKLAFVISLMAIVVTGCNNDDGQVEPDGPKPDGEALNQRVSDALADAKQDFTIDGVDGGVIEGERGTRINFYPNSFVDDQGNEVSGPIDITLIEVFSRAKMLLYNKPTHGRQEDGSISTLVSGGEFFVNATQGDGQLQLKEGLSFHMTVPTDTLDQAMQLFINEDKDCRTPDCDVVWEEQKGRIEIGDMADGAGMAYHAFVENFGWTNIDRWMNDPRPKTTLFVDVPEGYDDTNCAVYLTYDGEPTALARFDVYDGGQELFTEHYGKIPIGLKVHFIMVSVIDDQYNYAIQGATIGEGHIEVMGALSPTTEGDLLQMIEDLP